MTDIDKRILDQIIETQDISIVFQAIFDIKKQRIHGYEALTRGPIDSHLHAPLQLFATAERFGRLSELELISRKLAITHFVEQALPGKVGDRQLTANKLKLAITHFVEQALPGKLFLNVSPQVLLQRSHPSGETLHYLESCGLSSRRVVVEITEQQKVDDKMLRQASNHYRRLGFDIAIDDLGAGHSGLRQWSELMPDIVKVDRYFIENCHMDMVKKAFLKSIISLAKATNAIVIAEGIELEAEFRLLAQLGVGLCQGYYLEKPCVEPKTVFPPHVVAPAGPAPKLFTVRRQGQNSTIVAR